MSRIGKLPISIPAGVTVNYDNDSHVCTVKGPKGELSQWIDPSIKFINADGQISFEIDENSPVNVKQKQAFHGLYRSLVHNMVVGVSAGYTKVLELVGVGYRVSNQGNLIEFALGYTHPIFIQLPKEIKVETKSERNQNPILTLESCDKQCWDSFVQKFVLSASLSLIKVRVFSLRVKLFAESLVRVLQLSNFNYLRL